MTFFTSIFPWNAVSWERVMQSDVWMHHAARKKKSMAPDCRRGVATDVKMECGEQCGLAWLGLLGARM
jgi:hypothetical protein